MRCRASYTSMAAPVLARWSTCGCSNPYFHSIKEAASGSAAPAFRSRRPSPRCRRRRRCYACCERLPAARRGSRWAETPPSHPGTPGPTRCPKTPAAALASLKKLQPKPFAPMIQGIVGQAQRTNAHSVRTPKSFRHSHATSLMAVPLPLHPGRCRGTRLPGRPPPACPGRAGSSLAMRSTGPCAPSRSLSRSWPGARAMFAGTSNTRSCSCAQMLEALSQQCNRWSRNMTICPAMVSTSDTMCVERMTMRSAASA